MYYHLAAYLPALALALFLMWTNLHYNPDSMMLIGMAGMVWLFYMSVVCVVSGIFFSSSLQIMLLCTGINSLLIAIVYFIGMLDPLAPFYGLAGGVLSFAASGITMLFRHFFS